MYPISVPLIAIGAVAAAGPLRPLLPQPDAGRCRVRAAVGRRDALRRRAVPEGLARAKRQPDERHFLRRRHVRGPRRIHRPRLAARAAAAGRRVRGRPRPTRSAARCSSSGTSWATNTNRCSKIRWRKPSPLSNRTSARRAHDLLSEFLHYYLYAAQISPYEYNFPRRDERNERIHCDRTTSRPVRRGGRPNHGRRVRRSAVPGRGLPGNHHRRRKGLPAPPTQASSRRRNRERPGCRKIRQPVWDGGASSPARCRASNFQFEPWQFCPGAKPQNPADSAPPTTPSTICLSFPR